jgi:hypothetical protein
MSLASQKQPLNQAVVALLHTNNTNPLPVLCRYDDLKKARIVESWQQLQRLIADHAFPPGKLLSPNLRAFEVGEVLQWLSDRPSAPKKIVRPYRKDALARIADRKAGRRKARKVEAETSTAGFTDDELLRGKPAVRVR